MKKLFALLLALMMVLSLAACGGGDEKPSGNNDDPPASGQQQQQNTPDPDEGVDEPEETPDNSGSEEPPDPDPSGSTAVLHELYDIEQLADIPEFPDYAKKAIGDLRWCDDLGADRQFKYVYNAYMKEVTQEDFETYVANLTANAPTKSEEGNIFGFYWDWGQITGQYFPDSGTLDAVLAAK
ncbi:MAG: hypothetical protein IJE22_03450 [Oscillibacter sp.]|nr:hypothetical protein [Oscillibacter sp.]